MRTFSGSMVALATPFRDGALDEPAFRALVDFQVQGGTDVVLPMGTTGEAVTMTAAERERAIRVCVEAAAGRVPVVAGAGSNSTAETLQSVARARECGADGALIVTPYYNKPTQAGLVEHYRAVARAHPGFPLVAYNVPGRTGVDLLPDTCAQLCDIPEIVALKEATGNVARTVDIVEKCGTDRLVLLQEVQRVVPQEVLLRVLRVLLALLRVVQPVGQQVILLVVQPVAQLILPVVQVILRVVLRVVPQEVPQVD